MPAIAATEQFWENWQAGTFASSRAHDPPPRVNSEDAVSAELVETLPRVTEIPTPLALVMKGGGIKGLAYVGALEILARKYEFNWFVGTSAGAIIAILLGAGFTDGELAEILRDKDFRDFFDAKWYQLPFNLWFHKGFYHADSFTKWMDSLLAKKLRSPVRVSLSKLPKNKRVTVYASRRGKQVLTFDSFCSEDDAAYAARCSMSIPLVFVPQSHQGLRTYDGGIKYNYPVDKLLEDYPTTKFIGLYLGAEIYEGIGRTSVLTDIVSIVMESSEPDDIEKYRDSTVIIDPRPINTLDFSLTDEEKEFLLQTGRTAALAHLDDKSEEYAEAVKKRDYLKKLVEDTRNAAASKRRRNRRWALLVLFLLIGGVATWRFWLNAAPAKINADKLIPKTASVRISKLVESKTLLPLDGHQVLRFGTTAEPVFTDGVKVLFTLSHDRSSPDTITIRSLKINVIDYEANNIPKYLIDSSKINPLGIKQPHVFSIVLDGMTALPARWFQENDQATGGQVKMVESPSDNMLAAFPNVITLSLSTNDDDEHFWVTITARKPGWYKIGFKVDYEVGGNPESVSSDTFRIVKKELSE